MFFAEIQNKLLFAVTGQTAAEIVLNRADVDKPNMALTFWKGNVVRKQDIFIAKNYLDSDEIDTLNRLVVIFLETAELRAKNRIDITMKFWQENVDRILEFKEIDPQQWRYSGLKGPFEGPNGDFKNIIRHIPPNQALEGTQKHLAGLRVRLLAAPLSLNVGHKCHISIQLKLQTIQYTQHYF